MSEDDKNLLTLTPYYVIYSSNTNQPYIDSDGHCIFFEVHIEAEGYIEAVNKKIPDTLKIQDSKQFKIKELCADLYNLGAIGISVHKRAQKPINVFLSESDAKRAKKGTLFNNDTSRYVLRAQETHQKQFLRILKNRPFYAPIIISDRKEKQYPHVSYCYATFKTNEQFYILFTTLDEFNQWNATQQNEWSPLEVYVSKFDRIRKGNPVLINPMSNKFFLTNHTFNIIKSGPKN